MKSLEEMSMSFNLENLEGVGMSMVPDKRLLPRLMYKAASWMPRHRSGGTEPERRLRSSLRDLILDMAPSSDGIAPVRALEKMRSPETWRRSPSCDGRVPLS